MIRFNEREWVLGKEKPRPKSPQHEKFPMGKVDDVHDAEDHGKPQGHQDQNRSRHDSIDEALKDLLCAHSSLNRFWR